MSQWIELTYCRKSNLPNLGKLKSLQVQNLSDAEGIQPIKLRSIVWPDLWKLKPLKDVANLKKGQDINLQLFFHSVLGYSGFSMRQGPV